MTCRRLGAGLAQRGWGFHAYDQHGHGDSVESPEKRGLMESKETLIEHAVAFAKSVADEDQRAPIVLAGHSMGGAVMAQAARRVHDVLGSRLAGVVLIAPAFALDPAVFGRSGFAALKLQVQSRLTPSAPSPSTGV